MTNNQILKAILSINPNAEVNVGIDKDGVYDVTFHNGTAVISNADIEAKVAELPTAEEEAEAIATKKASGKAKLKELGLDDAEIKALIGA